MQPGDVIVSGIHEGVIFKIDTNGESIFFGGKPNITIFDLNDSYYGPGCMEIKNMDVEIETDRQKIVKAHRIIDNDLARYIADSMQLRKEFDIIHWNTISKMNKEDTNRKHEILFRKFWS